MDKQDKADSGNNGSDDVSAQDCSPTVEIEEGPFYKTGSPSRQAIVEPETPGNPLILQGYVFNRRCEPVAGAWVDFWQANGKGIYDNDGFNLRGHQYTDETGRYYLETVRPVEYGGRTAHLHVKVKDPKTGAAITTQLFFPEERRNETDRIFDSSLILTIVDNSKDVQKAEFNFVLNIS